MLTHSPELDRRIAEAIGWKLRGKAAIEWFDANGKPTGYCARNPFSPSTRLDHAFEAAEAVGLFMCDTQSGTGTNLKLFQGGGKLWWITNCNDHPVMQFCESTPALAICAAVLEVCKVRA